MKYSLSLLMGLMGALSTAAASPVLYTLNFTGGTPDATGSFDYDASLTSNPFSAFTVTWEGTTFNLTSAANTAPLDTETCAASTGAAEIFQSLTAPGCGVGGTSSEDWYADIQFNEIGIDIYGAAPSVSEVEDTTNNGNPVTSGTVQATSTAPEPATWGLVIAGGAVIAWRRRRGQTMGETKSVPN